MLALILMAVLGCRSEDTKQVLDTSSISELTEVEQMALSWCTLISCREGFDEAYAGVNECAGAYILFWTDASLEYNATSCFTDLSAVTTCTEALDAAACGADTPSSCNALITCQNNAFPAADTGT